MALQPKAGIGLLDSGPPFISVLCFHLPISPIRSYVPCAKIVIQFPCFRSFPQFHPVRGLESDFLVSTFFAGGDTSRQPNPEEFDVFCLAPKLWPVWHGRTCQQLRCHQHSSPLQTEHAIPPSRNSSVSGRDLQINGTESKSVWSTTLNEEHSFRVFENRFLRKILRQSGMK
jgi:hypothetical protein